MSILYNLLSVFPREVVCCILDYDQRFSVRNGDVREIRVLDKKDERRKMVFDMIRERALHLQRFYLDNYYNWRTWRPQLVIPINKYDNYVLRIWNAEYIRRDTGETFFEMTRELVVRRGRNAIESVCEY